MFSAGLLKFAVSNRQFIAFGFLAAFSSSFGQTYFIGIFGPEFQAEFGLSHTIWGSIYLIGTLASAAMLAVVIPYGCVVRQEQGSWLYGLTAPLGIIISGWVAWTALVAVLTARGIQWRGSVYR